MMMDRLNETLKNAQQALLDARTSEGHWCGELSSSALSTATALCAFTLARDAAKRLDYDGLIDGARQWLVTHQNEDGGWGDTVASPTNISTTTLCWAALRVADGDPAAVERASNWLAGEMGELTPRAIAETISARYGVDKTFSIPILTLCALAGCFGEGRSAWRGVTPLPFELGALPRRWFNRLGLPVVSYALPALIAVGTVIHHRSPSRNPLIRWIRNLAQPRTLRVLREIQPASGGFLEAAPLTSFVAMSLIGSGRFSDAVTQAGLDFLRETVRPDGSWPIDTNLCTWVTTLSVKALARDGALEGHLDASERRQLLDWLGAQQGKVPHPYTLADPGGWAWTDLSGGVPDGDDTPGALLALFHLAEKDDAGQPLDDAITEQARAGVRWLMGLQNKDGGIPTFCRGWGKLPFDKSCPDLTAHTLRAWFIWREALGDGERATLDVAAVRALTFLLAAQATDGHWTPLWFGNQAAPEQENPVYGTALTLGVPKLPDAPVFAPVRDEWAAACERASVWLRQAQGEEGGFGGAPGVEASIEETALALDALCHQDPEAAAPEVVDAIRRGVEWLTEATEGGTMFPAAPIGLYFAKLWYHEQLYPLVHTVSGLAHAQQWLQQRDGKTVAS